MLITSAAKMRFQSETYWPTKPAIADRHGLLGAAAQVQQRGEEVVPEATALSTSAVTVIGLSIGKHHEPEGLQRGAAVDEGGVLEVPRAGRAGNPRRGRR